MGEEDLQININAVDNATEQLNAVASTADEMAQTVGEAASSIDEALGGSEEAVSQYTQTWEESLASLDEMMSMSEGEMNQMLGVTEETTAQMSAAYQSLAAATGTTAAEVENNLTGITAAQEYLTMSATEAAGTFDEDMGAMSMAAITAAGEITSSLDDAGAAANGTAESTFGYFRNMIAGLGIQKVGEAAVGAVKSAIGTATAGQDTMQIQTLRSQIDRLNASIETQRASLENTVGTTDQLAARHANVAAQIESENLQIEKLKIQLAPLEAAQQGSGKAAQQMAQETRQLNTDWSGLMGYLAGPSLASLTGTYQTVDKLIKSVTDWAKENPEATKEILTFTAAIGYLFEALGAAAIAIAMIELVMMAGLGPFLLWGIAISVVVALVLAFHTQIMGALEYLNSKTGILDVFKQAWSDISDAFMKNLLPALKQLWDALQPLMPYLKILGEIAIGGIIIAIEALVKMITAAVVILTDLLTILTKIATFLTDVFTAAIGLAKKGIDDLVNTPGFKQVLSFMGAIGGAASSVGAAVGGAGAWLGSQISKLADGGIVSSPTLALVGEAGPEAVIPLSAFNNGLSLAGSGSRGGGGGITVNITGTFLSQDAARQLSQMMITSLNRQVRLSSFV